MGLFVRVLALLFMSLPVFAGTYSGTIYVKFTDGNHIHRGMPSSLSVECQNRLSQFRHVVNTFVKKPILEHAARWRANEVSVVVEESGPILLSFDRKLAGAPNLRSSWSNQASIAIGDRVKCVSTDWQKVESILAQIKSLQN